MYCINCGVKLADTEKTCPLCGTVVYHPQIRQEKAAPLYPENRFPAQDPRSLAAPIILSTVFLMPLLISLLCDLQLNGVLTWSGFVVGALLLAYVITVLPIWFKKPNPVLLLICDFVMLNLYLYYINGAVDGVWFWGFGFPIATMQGIVVTAVTGLLRRIPRAGLYIFGGAAVALGIYMPLQEYLVNLTFQREAILGWSLYPLVALVLLGLMLIFLGANRTARSVLERKFFL